MRCVLGLLLSTVIGAYEAPAFRLPDLARPMRMELDLTIIPKEPTFHGIVRIDLDFAKPTHSLWLNAKGLTVDSASLSTGGPFHPVKADLVDDEFLHLQFDNEAVPGPARVEIAYHGVLSDKSNVGLYRKNAGSDWYAFTTFTPIEARRAFPCFDEPGYKSPWHIVLHVPQTDVAASNAPLASEKNEPAGMKRVEFKVTKPLPSEVVAVAVGPFDVVAAGDAGSRHIPVRILAPHGRGLEAEGARQATPEILARLEQYTGIPYPWDKLDHVAVLDMPYGAVENPGLITYRDRILLQKPGRDTAERQRGMRGTMAHELAHQWFGNLVTQAWWDDAWLSEGFATWLGGKISDQELPVFERSINAAAARVQMLHTDASSDTRPVRLAMNSRTEMDRVYSGIVYQKGAAILNMVEQWLGPEPFRRGLHTYLTAHALANATTDDLADALRKESGVEVSAVLHSFLDQTGYPSIQSSAACSFQTAQPVRWTIPLCIHADEGASQCAVLSQAQPELTLGGTCPAWVWPNRAGAGYFRVSMPASKFESFMKTGWDQMSAPEKLSAIDDASELAGSRVIDADTLIRLLPAMARDPQPAVANAAYRLLIAMMTSASPEERLKYDTAARQILNGGRGRR